MIYVPQAFREPDRDRLHALMREHAFATLVSPDAEDPCVTHLPLLLDAGAGPLGTLRGHVARGNPHGQRLAGGRALAIFHGPHAYVSPSWYAEHPAVPTWNYAVVHASGPVRLIEDAQALDALVGELVHAYEDHRAAPWRMQLPADYQARMREGIIGFELAIERLEGKYKLSQNRPASDRLRVAQALAAGSAGDAAVAALMAAPPSA